MVESISTDADQKDVDERVENHRATEVHDQPQPPDGKGEPDGVAELDDTGTLRSGQVPNLAVTDTFTVTNEADLTGLDAQVGDVGIVTSQSQSYILTGDPSSLSNWVQFETPPAPVQDVFGRTGSVTPSAGDYSASQITNFNSTAAAAAPVQDVEGKTGNVTLGPSDVEAEPSGSVEDHRQNETHATAQPPEAHGDGAHNGQVPRQYVQTEYPPVGDVGDVFKRLDDRGTVIWSITGKHPDGTESVYENDGVVYSAGRGGAVKASDIIDGSQIWSHTLHPTGARINTVFARNGAVYSGGGDGVVVAANASDGTQVWTYQTDPAREVYSVYERAGVVYIGDRGNDVTALDASDGSEIWNHSLHSDFVYSVFERGGVVYSGANDVIAADASDGSEIWRHSLNPAGVQSVHERNGVVYSGGLGDTLVAADSADGSEVSSKSLSFNIRDLFERNGVVYYAGDDFDVAATDAIDFSEIWSAAPFASFTFSVHERNGVLYVGGLGGDLWAIVSDPSTYVSNGSEWVFQSRGVPDREGGQLG